MKNWALLFFLFCAHLGWAEPTSVAPDDSERVLAIPSLADDVKLESSGELKALEPSKNYLSDLRSGKIEQSIGGRLMGLVGCFAMLLIAFFLSDNKRKISWRLVGIGVAMQFAFAFIVLKLEAGRVFFDGANVAILRVLRFAGEGSAFVFGNLVSQNVPVGAPLSNPAIASVLIPNGSYAHVGAFFAFTVLPTIVFFSALTAVLYHLKVLQFFVRIIAFVMHKTLRTSGAETFSAAANIFVGQTEAPLLIKPFLANLTRSEIMAVMAGGMATVAGGVLAAYVATLTGYFPDIAGHLIAASVMSAPAALVMAKIMVPEVDVPETASAQEIVLESPDANILDAAAKGTSDGLQLALNVGAMLVAFIGLIALFNWLISSSAAFAGFDGLTLERLFSWAFAPIAFLLGVPWVDAPIIGALFGTKTVLNEFVAYIQLAGELERNTINHSKSVAIATYALCGFSNFSSIGIQIGGLSALAPARRKEFASLGLRAMIAGALACFQTAAIAGMLL